MRLFSLLLSICLTISASHAIKVRDNQANTRSASLNTTNQISLCKAALSRDPANPYRWSSLAAAFRAAGDLPQASQCYRRAVDLSGAVPQVLLDAATFYFDQKNFDQALSLAARILKTVPDYDSVLFPYFDRFLPDPSPVFIAIGLNRRPVRAYAQHLIDLGDMKSARLAWRFAQAAHFTDDRLASSYLDGMILRAHRYMDAQHDWAEYLGSACGDYPHSNLLFNAGFEREPTGSSMDWRIQASDKFDTIRDNSVAHAGKFSLQIRFQGSENTPYNNVSQTTSVTPGLYYLQAWVRTDHITGNQGPYLEVIDAEVPRRLEVRTDPATGTNDWRLIVQPFMVPPQTSLVTVRVVRDPSPDADDRIAGTYWLDEVRLARE